MTCNDMKDAVFIVIFLDERDKIGGGRGAWSKNVKTHDKSASETDSWRGYLPHTSSLTASSDSAALISSCNVCSKATLA